MGEKFKISVIGGTIHSIGDNNKIIIQNLDNQESKLSEVLNLLPTAQRSTAQSILKNDTLTLDEKKEALDSSLSDVSLESIAQQVSPSISVADAASIGGFLLTLAQMVFGSN